MNKLKPLMIKMKHCPKTGEYLPDFESSAVPLMTICDGPDVLPEEVGHWVPLDEYKKLQSEIERLRAETQQLRADLHVEIKTSERLRAELQRATSPRPPVEKGKFVRAWLQLEALPGKMMAGPDGPFGPIGAMTSCAVTTSESFLEDWERRGMPYIEVWLPKKLEDA